VGHLTTTACMSGLFGVLMIPPAGWHHLLHRRPSGRAPCRIDGIREPVAGSLMYAQHISVLCSLPQPKTPKFFFPPPRPPPPPLWGGGPPPPKISPFFFFTRSEAPLG